MSRRDTRTPEEREHAELVRRWEERDARMNETMSRRDILEAIDRVHHDLTRTGCGTDTYILIDALRRAFK